MNPHSGTTFALRLHPDDNVLVAARDLPMGTRIPESSPIELRQQIGLGTADAEGQLRSWPESWGELAAGLSLDREAFLRAMEVIAGLIRLRTEGRSA